jgi:hypothetical protein
MALEMRIEERGSLTRSGSLTPFRSKRRAPASDVGSGSSSGSNIGDNDMKRLSSRALSAGAILVLLSMTPAFAQVAGNPGDLHTQTLYMKQYKSLRGYTAKATDPNKAPEATSTNCGVFHDFNTSQSHFGYIAVCPLFPFFH